MYHLYNIFNTHAQTVINQTSYAIGVPCLQDYLRQFMGAFRDRAAATRVFFPDNTELKVAQNGQTEDPAAGTSNAWSCMYTAHRMVF